MLQGASEGDPQSLPGLYRGPGLDVNRQRSVARLLHPVRSSRFLIALLGASSIAFAAAAPAFAEDPPPPAPPGTPSIDQYVETVPTGSGGASPGVGKPRAKSLPRRVRTKLRARPDSVTKRLEAIATSSVYGAPQRDLSSPKTGSARGAGARTSPKTTVPKTGVSPKTTAPKADVQRRKPSREPNVANPLSAAVSAVSDTSDSHLYWLLAAMIVVTTGMVWAGARRHRA